MKKKDYQWSIRIFDEGEFIDLWTISHFLAGSLFFAALYMLGVSVLTSFIILVVYAIGWEAYEHIFNIRESKKNKLIDAVLQAAGFFIVYYLFIYTSIGHPTVLIIVSAILVIIEIFGLRAYRATTETSMLGLPMHIRPHIFLFDD